MCEGVSEGPPALRASRRYARPAHCSRQAPMHRTNDIRYACDSCYHISLSKHSLCAEHYSALPPPDATARATNLFLQLRCQCVDGVGLCGNRSHLRPPHSPLTPAERDQPWAQYTDTPRHLGKCVPPSSGEWTCSISAACGARPGGADHGLGGRGHGRHDHPRERLREGLRSRPGPRARLRPRPCRPTLSSR
jgi:hypothetical protein